MSLRNRYPGLMIVAALIALVVVPAQAAGPTTTRVSVSSNGIESSGDADYAAVSADGAFVAFSSSADDLVSGDGNAKDDVFLRELASGVTIRVSVASSGKEATGDSKDPAVSADGRFIVFDSLAEDLVSGDSNTKKDVFIHDRQTHQTTLVSVSSTGVQGDNDSYDPSISADGRFVAFESFATTFVAPDTLGVSDVFVHDRLSGQTTRVSVGLSNTEANLHSEEPVISADGRFVAFTSYADNLVSGDLNGVSDIFLHDRVTGKTSRVSVATDGTEANKASERPSISPDGRAVAYESDADNLVAGDKNGFRDIFLTTGSNTVRVNLGLNGAEVNASSYSPEIGAGGSFVVYETDASNVVTGDSNALYDIFLVRGGKATRVSVRSDGAEGNADSYRASISANGSTVAFTSSANDLVDGDTNGFNDVFVSVLEPSGSSGLTFL